MNATALGDGNIGLDLSLDELSWFGQALNECCGGFGLKDFKRTIGAEEAVVRQLLGQIVSNYPATLGDGG